MILGVEVFITLTFKHYPIAVHYVLRVKPGSGN